MLRKLAFLPVIFVCACSTDEPVKEKQQASGPVIIESSQGDFLLQLEADKTSYHVNEEVPIVARLKYTGTKESVMIYHSTSPFWFHMKEKERNIDLPYAQNMPLLHTTLIKDKWLEEVYRKGGGFSESDPNADFIKKFFTAKTFPQGKYEMTLIALFHMENDSGRMEYNIPLTFNFEVTGDDSLLVYDSQTTLNEYSLIANDRTIPLRAWEKEIAPEQILGKPASESTRVLGEGADTHSGSSVKTLTYPGLKIEVFIPGSNDTGWIMNMHVTGNQYQTARGTKVGDHVEEVKKLYPEGAVFPDGRTNKLHYAWYISDAGNNLTLKFEINNDKVKEIMLYHEIP